MTNDEMRPYQKEIEAAVTDSVLNHKGLTFSVEIARQGGKNELSAQIEAVLLSYHCVKNWNIIKCAPTFMPQALISLTRLRDRMDGSGFKSHYAIENRNTLRLVNARAIFLSADESASVVGNTAHILLEIDESQDVSKEKYSKLFKS